MVQTSLKKCWNNKSRHEMGEEEVVEEEEQLIPRYLKYSANNNKIVVQMNSILEGENSENDDDDDSHVNSLGDMIDGLDKKEELEDPVGDIIAAMLNEESVPYFTYQNYLQQQRMLNSNTIANHTIDWTHILSVRNIRAVRRLILNIIRSDNDGGQSSTIKFLLEIFLVAFVMVYSVSDIALRTTFWVGMMTFMWIVRILIDLDEIHHGLVELIGSKWVERLTSGTKQCQEYSLKVMEVIHTVFLWGDYFQGRTIIWSEEDRLPKFRRKHMALIRINKERRENAKTIRRLGRVKKLSKRKKDLIEGAAETAVLDEVKILLLAKKQELDASMKELNQKPPTYFPTSVQMEKEGETSINHHPCNNATNGHMEALRFCHKMVFLRDQEAQQQPKSSEQEIEKTILSIMHTSSDWVDHDIEVVSNEVNVSSYRVDDEVESDTSTAVSDYPSIGDHWDSETDGDSLSHASSVSASDQALPWIAVGAKIGGKLLKSRKLQRVVANPDELQKTIPIDALKLFDGEDATNKLPSSLSEQGEKQPEKGQQKQEMVPIKRPVHRMWTDPGQKPGNVNMATPKKQGAPSRFPVIEMPTSFNDTSFSAPSPAKKSNNNISLFKETPIDRQKRNYRLAPIEKGVRIVVPLFSPDPNISITVKSNSFYQMGTVISSRRFYVPSSNVPTHVSDRSNCLFIKVVLDKAILRGCRFAEMNLRIMDEWNYTPIHSKFPIGSCVATTFGLGVLVGWRVEDDMHIIRSLWNRSGPGSGVAFLRRDSLHSVVQAAVGFDVETTYGPGKVVGYVNGGKQNITGKYVINMQHDIIRRTLSRSRVVELSRFQILSCRGAIFVPVTEHIRAAALYQLELFQYKARVREQTLNVGGEREKGTWRNFSEYVDLFAVSFSKAISEDPDFDQEFNKFIYHIIGILEGDVGSADSKVPSANGENEETIDSSEASDPSVSSGTWNLQDFLKCLWAEDNICLKNVEIVREEKQIMSQTQAFEEAHDSVLVLIRVLMRTTIVARASVSNRPKLHIALSMIHEGLLLIRQLLRIHKKHTSTKLLQAWFRTINEISTTFGPWRQRTAALWDKMLRKLSKHGTVAKRRLLRFVDICLGDTLLLPALELGDWKTSILRFEASIVKSEIADKKTCEQLRKGVKILYKNFVPRKRDKHTRAAAARSGQKAMTLAKVMKIVATPSRSLLKLLTHDDVLDHFDRVLLRVFEKDPLCSMTINIFATHFYSVRHLRYLNNMSISGKLWETVLDAVDEELNFAISTIPKQTQDFLKPFVKLFSLGVSQFHDIQSGAVTAEWLDFLLEDESVKIIQELDRRLIDFLDSFCRDVKTIFEVMPYIKTIDRDILNLIDEFDPDLLLRELSDSIGDSEKFISYVKVRTTTVIERFLDYLPKMSIPIERRELEGGWVLTCRGKKGGDLCLSDISMDRENLRCYVLGGDENVLQPLANTVPRAKFSEPTSFDTDSDFSGDESILYEVRELIESAQKYNNWVVGVNGIKDSSQFKGIPKPLDGLPMSDTLRAGIDLWQTSAICDFELLEIAIRDVSYQISVTEDGSCNKSVEPTNQQTLRQTPHVFNPKLDPTVLFLDIKNLTMSLKEFTFRVEKKLPTIFDPVFEGGGSIKVKNMSLVLKVEIKKERVEKNGVELCRPVFHLTKLDVGLEKLKIVFTETGADWILNSVLKGFRRQTSEIVEAILKEQITHQVHNLLESANGFIDANPDVLMVALGITLKDLEESIVSV